MQDMNTASSFRTSLQLSALLAILILSFHSTALSLYSRWIKFDQSLSHGLPTVAIFTFLLWKITATSGTRDQTSLNWFLTISLGVLSIIWYLVEAINLQLASAALLLALFALYIASSFSLKTARQLLPLIAMFLFTIPVWGELTDVLVEISSFVVGRAVEIIGITALIEGNNILIPSGIIQIAEGCSGLRYLTISLLLAYILSLINGYNLRQSIVALIVGTLLGLLTNWIRIIALVVIGYNTNMQSSLMHDHEMFGWILFSLIILPALYLAPLVQKHINFNIETPPFKPFIPTLFLIIGPVLFIFSERNADYSNRLDLNGFNFSQNAMRDINLVEIPFPETIAVSNNAILIDGTDIKLTLAKSIAPPTNRKLVPYIGNFFDNSDWVATEQRTVNIDGEKFTLLILKKINASHQSLLMYQFNIGKSNTASYRMAKLLQLKARLLGEDFFGLLAMQANCKLDCDDEIIALRKAASEWHKIKRQQLRQVIN
ncbi:MAG: exosortase/archaeosortase family protein [Gammaproteobacteria bacterium]|nr:MAG: exosortase/archaeosortase family protein [Gammaproteobacteria bacterium]